MNNCINFHLYYLNLIYTNHSYILIFQFLKKNSDNFFYFLLFSIKYNIKGIFLTSCKILSRNRLELDFAFIITINVYEMLKLASYKTLTLSQKQKDEILKLKDTYWRYGLASQRLYFEKNFQKKDLNNLLYYKDKLIGYTALRYKTFKNKKKIKFLLFDTLIIHKQFRNKGFSNLLMKFNNFVIKNQKIPSYLICRKKITNFYKKNYWKIDKTKEAILIPKKKDQIVMSLNKLYYA